MFLGEHNHSVDDKGRMFLPAKFREELGKTVIITQGIDKCLYIFPESTWMEFATGLAKKVDSSIEVRKLQRMFIGRAISCDVDKQGRIVIPPKTRATVGITNNVTIVGMMNKLEVWDTDTLNGEELDTEQVQDLMQKLEFSGSSYGI